MNPVHFDEEFARKTIFRGRVAHGALSIGYISGVIGTQLPGGGAIFVSASIVFKTPVRIGDTVVTTVTVREVQGREAVLDCVCKVGDKQVLESEARVLVPRRPRQGLMKIFRHYDDVPAALRGAVVAIGNFDGVHLGHQALIAEARAQARSARRAAGGAVVRAASAGIFQGFVAALPAGPIASA